MTGKSVKSLGNERSSEVILRFKGVKGCRLVGGMFGETDC